MCECVSLLMELYPEVKAGEGERGGAWSDQRKKSQPPSRLLHL